MSHAEAPSPERAKMLDYQRLHLLDHRTQVRTLRGS